jgi:site-specific DNA-methyltransferase (adenine-specific)
MNTNYHFSSKSDEWITPQWLFDALDFEFGFTLDPCSTHENAKCKRHFTIEENGLEQDWSGETVFMNPPYGRNISLWMRKAYAESLNGAVVVCVIAARTDRKWWHSYAMRGEIRLLRKRVKFANAEYYAPFPTAIVVFRPPTFLITRAEFSRETTKEEE